MRKKRIFWLTVILSILGVVAAVESGAQAERNAIVTQTANSATGYRAQVAAVQRRYAAERSGLGLSNKAGIGFTPESVLSDMGCPRCQNVAGGSAGGSGAAATETAGNSVCAASSRGAPVWMVNMVNINFYMADTPLWYESPVGPPVEIKLSYNSQSALGGTLGNKWRLSYDSYLYPKSGTGAIVIVMPDGKRDSYVPRTGGGYSSPYQMFTTLAKISANRYELRFPHGSVYVYDIPAGTVSSVSLLVEIRDPYGQKLGMGYDANARLTRVTDALGKVTTLLYNATGRLTRVTDPFGRYALFEYDANSNLTKITDMGGYWTGFTYRNYSGNDYYPASLTNAAGSWGFNFEPNDDGYPETYPAPGATMGGNYRITVTNPGGGKEEFFYSATKSLSWHVRPKNYVPYSGADNNNGSDSVPKTTFEFVSNSASMGEVGATVSPEGYTRSFGYDDAGNITSLDIDGFKGTFTCNSMGNKTSVTDAKGNVTNYAYAANGVDLTGITNGLGTFALTYNAYHDVTSVTDRLGNKKYFSYNGYGQLTSATDPLGILTGYNYDANHQLTQVTRGGYTLRSYTYDSHGMVRSYTDASGLKSVYDYNNLDDVTRITYPDGKTQGIAYSDKIPHLIQSITDRSGRTTRFTYDAARKLLSMVNTAGGTTSFDYNVNGNMAHMTDPKGNVTGFDYDNDNRLVKKIFADGASNSFDYYDYNNKLGHYYNARNGYAIYSYDQNYNVAGITYSSPLTLPVTYQYDNYNRLTKADNYASPSNFGYDAESRLTSIDGPFDNDTITITYDKKGRRSGYALAGGQTVAYGYDDLDRLTSIHAGAGTFSYAYSGAGPEVRKLTRPNGSYTEYQYDSLNRLTMISNRNSSGAIINQYAYTYNEQDLRSVETITNGASITASTNGTSTYTYNGVNELLSASGPNRAFTYDADGNMTQGYTPDGKVFTTFHDYDFKNRPTILKLASGFVIYTYNGMGFLAKKEDDTETRYVLYGALPLQERDGNNKTIREYGWGVSYGGGIGGLLSLKQGGADYYYLYDGRGNVTALIDSSQNVVATYGYDPFGKLLSKSGTLDQPYRFSTKPYDERTGLYNYGYRFYSPSIGRWITRDPIGERGGLNLYEFTRSNPVNSIDPYGLDTPKSHEELVKALEDAVNANSKDDPSGSSDLSIWDTVKKFMESKLCIGGVCKTPGKPELNAGTSVGLEVKGVEIAKVKAECGVGLTEAQDARGPLFTGRVTIKAKILKIFDVKIFEEKTEFGDVSSTKAGNEWNPFGVGSHGADSVNVNPQ